LCSRSRLLYQSKKRGIVENDIILGEFAEKHLPTMEREDLLSYDKLINGEHMEWDLYYFMCGKKEPPEEVAASTVFKMVKKFIDEREIPKK
uniref:SDHAF2 n=1 Tax=Angiostrongylus cantonensis TaxID=6313 RepID=A0A0K0DGK9_ANGCA